MILIPPLSLALPSFLSLPVTRHVFNLPTMKIIISNYLYSPSYIYYEVNLLLTFTLIKHSFVSKMTTNIHVTQFSASKLSIDMKFIWSTSKRFFLERMRFHFFIYCDLLQILCCHWAYKNHTFLVTAATAAAPTGVNVTIIYIAFDIII